MNPALPGMPEPDGFFTTTDDGRWIEASDGHDLSRCTKLYSGDKLLACFAAGRAEASKDAERMSETLVSLRDFLGRYDMPGNTNHLVRLIDAALSPPAATPTKEQTP